MKELNLLFTSVGRRSYLIKYFKEALNGRGLVHVANSSDISPAFLIADKHVITPLIYDKNYIPFLLKYCSENSISAIISLFDVDLLVLSKNKEKFEEIGTTVIVSDSSVISICNDKWHTYKFLLENGLNAPKTFISLLEVKTALNEGAVEFPLFVKPRWGMGSISVYEVETVEELDVFFKRVMRDIQKSYLKYESAKNIGESVLIQEKMFGQEYNLDIINDLNGNYQTTIIKAKNSMRSGETDCAVTVYDPSIKALGKLLAEKLKHVGNLDCDIFIWEDKPTVLELNARFGGGYPFSHLAGVNLPFAMIEWLQGNMIDKAVLKEEIGVLGQKDIEIVRLK